MGFSSFAKEIIMLPSDWANMLHPLKFYRKHSSGGHFASWERYALHILLSNTKLPARVDLLT